MKNRFIKNIYGRTFLILIIIGFVFGPLMYLIEVLFYSYYRLNAIVWYWLWYYFAFIFIAAAMVLILQLMINSFHIQHSLKKQFLFATILGFLMGIIVENDEIYFDRQYEEAIAICSIIVLLCNVYVYLEYKLKPPEAELT